MNPNRIYYSREAELQAARERSTMTVFYVVLALAAGALVALMFAPESGKEMRGDIGQRVGGGLESGRHALEPAVEQLGREIKDLRDRVENRLS